MNEFELIVVKVDNGYIVRLNTMPDLEHPTHYTSETNVFTNRFDALEYIDTVLTTSDDGDYSEEAIEYIRGTDLEDLEVVNE
jgi:hypothetical protein